MKKSFSQQNWAIVFARFLQLSIKLFWKSCAFLKNFFSSFTQAARTATSPTIGSANKADTKFFIILLISYFAFSAAQTSAIWPCDLLAVFLVNKFSQTANGASSGFSPRCSLPTRSPCRLNLPKRLAAAVSSQADLTSRRILNWESYRRQNGNFYNNLHEVTACYSQAFGSALQNWRCVLWNAKLRSASTCYLQIVWQSRTAASVALKTSIWTSGQLLSIAFGTI